MNILNTIESIHLRASRSLDVTLIQNSNGKRINQQLIYIYNYEGVHYRVFKTLNDFFNFIDNLDDNCICEFDNETEMENYLTLEFEIK